MSDPFATPRTVAHQASLSVCFPKQKYRSGLPFPSPADLPDAGIKSMSLALAGGFFTTEPPGKSKCSCVPHKFICLKLIPKVMVLGDGGLWDMIRS